MKIASFNVENFFDRARAFNLADADKRAEVLGQVAEFNMLIGREAYSDDDKKRLLKLLAALGVLRQDEGQFVRLRRIRGPFLKRPRSTHKKVEIVADGREDWIGWMEHKTEPVSDIAIDNTARVIRDVDADIIAVVEADNRVALKQFSASTLQRVQGRPYDQIMLIDGNDDRGIDVGLMCKLGYDIGLMRSHIHELGEFGEPIFARDCPEFAVTTPKDELIWVIPNHFSSKFGGDNPQKQARRLAQAARAAALYNGLRAEGQNKVVVLGDLNDTPDSPALAPLLVDTDLKDISDHPTFDTGEFKGRPGSGERGYGTFGLGNDGDKIDYLLLSPELFDRVTAGGLFRKGAWPGKKKRWTVYPELTEERFVASDHHVIWAEISEP